jgi:4-amino-4-deoxy-L-arabinose transferase-like glycosyltransferase
MLAGRARRWLPVLLAYAGSALLVLLHPGITPDHPFADRRLVVEVLPGLAILATWTFASVLGRIPVGRLRLAVAVALLAAYLAPMAVVTVPLAPQRTEQGELAAARAVCQALVPDDSVVLTDPLWMPTIRGQCGLPVAQLPQATPDAVRAVVAGIRATGRVPVIAGATAGELRALGLTPIAAADLETRQDQQQLVIRPNGTEPLAVQFFYAMLPNQRAR